MKLSFSFSCAEFYVVDAESWSFDEQIRFTNIAA